jgi:hypothetical protein
LIPQMPFPSIRRLRRTILNPLAGQNHALTSGNRANNEIRAGTAIGCGSRGIAFESECRHAVLPSVPLKESDRRRWILPNAQTSPFPCGHRRLRRGLRALALFWKPPPQPAVWLMLSCSTCLPITKARWSRFWLDTRHAGPEPGSAPLWQRLADKACLAFRAHGLIGSPPRHPRV